MPHCRITSSQRTALVTGSRTYSLREVLNDRGPVQTVQETITSEIVAAYLTHFEEDNEKGGFQTTVSG